MNTDQITENLYKQAIDLEKSNLQRAAKSYNQAIGLSGSTEVIKLKGKKEGDPEIEIYIAKVLEEITIQLLEKRDKRIKTNAVNDFLNKFSAFNNYMHQMEEL